MLGEIAGVRQVEGEPLRRWFAGDRLDLILWQEAGAGFVGFQLCYRDRDGEKALTWRTGRGFTHHRVDDGEDVGLGHKMAPVLRPDGKPDRAALVELLEAEAGTIDPAVGAFVASAVGTLGQTPAMGSEL